MEENELQEILIDTQKEYTRSNKVKDKKSLTYIADELGMSEVTVKRKHRKMLMKLGSVF